MNYLQKVGLRILNIKGLDLSKPKSQERISKRIENIYKYRYRIRLQMDNWAKAIRAAEDTYNPNREMLYALYRETLRDGHLVSQINTQLYKVLEEAFTVVDKKTGKEDIQRKDLFERVWFFDFCQYALEHALWGHSLIEFGKFIDSNSDLIEKEIGSVKVFPRIHVKPEYGLIVAFPFDKTGIPYREKPYNQFLIEVGKNDFLGTLQIATKCVIRKENSLTDWAIRSERFGMPLSILKTASRDSKELDSKEQWLSNLGSNGYAILDDMDTLDLKESTQSDAYKIYKEYVDIMNLEVSKLISGQTLTSEAGKIGSQALGNVHERILDTYVIASMRFLQFVINFELIPKLIEFGYPLEGYKFQYKYFASKEGQESELSSEPEPQPITEPEPEPTPEQKAREKEINPYVYPFNKKGLNFKGLLDDVLIILEKVFNGDLKRGDIDETLWQYYTNQIIRAIIVGYEGSLSDFDIDTPDYVMLEKLNNSAQVFAAHKNYQFIGDLEDLVKALRNEEGALVSFSTFKTEALKIHTQYNIDWLRTEYNMSIAGAQAARKWVEIEANRELFPNIKYKTVGDENVRDSHRKLNNIILPIDDVFWNTNYPPNGWGCRCFVQSTDEDITAIPNGLPTPENGFSNNIGKTGQLFDKSHSYYQVDATDKENIDNFLNNNVSQN